MKPAAVTLSILLAGHLFFTACNNAESENAQPATVKTTKKNSKKKSRLLCTQSQTHSFSEKGKRDVFKLTIIGDSVLAGTAHFDIINTKGKTIYSADFPAVQLLNYEISSSASDAEKEKFIRKRVREFFFEENFRTPAVHSDDKFDSDYSNKKYWDAIKADRAAIGFYYLLGEEDGRSIAWSKKLKKVVLYFNCC